MNRLKSSSHFPRNNEPEYFSSRVFWANKYSLESVKVDGSDRKQHGGTTENDFVDISVFEVGSAASDTLGPDTLISFFSFGSQTTSRPSP